MNYYYTAMVIFLLLNFFLVCSFANATETVVLTAPEPLSIINGDMVRIKVEASQAVDWVELFASYENLEGIRIEKSFGQINNPPYEALWDCRMVPDQNCGRLFLYFNYHDSSGLHEKIGNRTDVAIDRNTEISSKIMKILYVNQAPVIDGDLSDWDRSKFQKFSSSDNTVEFYCVWDKTALYFGIEIYDKYVFCFKEKGERLRFPHDTTSYPQIWLGDGIELNFDVYNNKKSIRDTTHREIMISADGILTGIVQDNFKRRINYWGENIDCKIKISGTLNDDNDSDSGYRVELAVPWEDLYDKLQKEAPKKHGLEIGFTLFNYDRENVTGNWTFGSWNPHIVTTNNDNPSEWGTIVLQKRGYYLYLIPLFILIMALLIWPKIRTRGKKNPERDDESVSPVDPIDKLFIIHEGKNYPQMKSVIQDLWANPGKKYMVNDLLDKFNLGPDRVRQLFVHFTGKSFKELFLYIKIEKAKQLLIDNKELSVSQIAYDLGYEQAPQFSKIFKKFTGLPPQEYREKG
ncbi:MAG: helix-turn-helix domain-containing protein [Fibrobacteria bacterium]|nr:helix-turn-helix domain-containing protein [Fibrobacteria bacterium]